MTHKEFVPCAACSEKVAGGAWCESCGSNCALIGSLKRGEKSMKLPHQPMHMDGDVIRFVPNKIVCWLLDAGPFDLNQIAMLPGISDEEHSQFAQLIGYSVSGYGDLSYAVDVDKLDEVASKLCDERLTK